MQMREYMDLMENAWSSSLPSFDANGRSRFVDVMNHAKTLQAALANLGVHRNVKAEMNAAMNTIMACLDAMKKDQ